MLRFNTCVFNIDFATHHNTSLERSFIKDIEAILDLNKVQIHEFKITKDSFNSTIKTQLV